jgi:hypothetical protein
MPTTAKPTPSWRDALSIHPACDLFPTLPPDELRALGEDIVKNGLTSPIVLWRADPKGQAQLLDGRNRLDGIEIATGPAIVGAPSITAGEDFLACNKVIVLDKSVDPYAYVVSTNIRRRHLTAEQKRDLIAKLIKTTPERSDRQIAKVVKVDHKTVASVRAEKEGCGEIPHVAIRTDTKGRKQPAKRMRNYIRARLHRAAKLGDDVVAKLKGTSLDNAREMDELVILNRGAPEGGHTEIVKRLIADAVTGKAVSAIAVTENGLPPPRDDIGSYSASEAARLQARNEELERENHRLQCENIALRSEIEDLRTRLAMPPLPAPTDDGLDIPAWLRRAPA